MRMENVQKSLSRWQTYFAICHCICRPSSHTISSRKIRSKERMRRSSKKKHFVSFELCMHFHHMPILFNLCAIPFWIDEWRVFLSLAPAIFIRSHMHPNQETEIRRNNIFRNLIPSLIVSLLILDALLCNRRQCRCILCTNVQCNEAIFFVVVVVVDVNWLCNVQTTTYFHCCSLIRCHYIQCRCRLLSGL